MDWIGQTTNEVICQVISSVFLRNFKWVIDVPFPERRKRWERTELEQIVNQVLDRERVIWDVSVSLCPSLCLALSVPISINQLLHANEFQLDVFSSVKATREKSKWSFLKSFLLTTIYYYLTTLCYLLSFEEKKTNQKKKLIETIVNRNSREGRGSIEWVERRKK